MRRPANALAAPIDGRLASAIRQALRRVTLRVIVATALIAFALEAWQAFEFLSEPYPAMLAREAHVSATIINLCMAFGIMLTTFVADELVAAGARRLPAYGCAVALGCLVGTLAQWQAHEWLRAPAITNDVRLPGIYDLPGDHPDVAVTQPAVMFFEYLIWGSIVVFVYVNRRTALAAAARMNAAQIARAKAQKRTLESRLQALQARIEPVFLLGTLQRVRDLYDRDPASGRQVLADLITYLRAALPHLRESASTLAQELALAGAYLSIMRALDGRFSVDIDAPDAARAARLPALMLLPLVARVLGGATETGRRASIRIAARADRGRLRLEIEGGSNRGDAQDDDVLRGVRERLDALYGAAASLTRDALGANGHRLVMEIPHERADGDHR